MGGQNESEDSILQQEGQYEESRTNNRKRTGIPWDNGGLRGD
jgi:hypothetical protein